ncbi:MAG: carboxylating nicotinate-nucleotide diphosphorylase [Aaplasma endosymbiont of Hyalomma asiaticum]
MLENIIKSALEEDLNSVGDITTSCIIGDEKMRFNINAREDLIVAGMKVIDAFSYIFNEEELFLSAQVDDGTPVTAGTCIVAGHGSVAKVLSVERTILNFIQRASGIASLTRLFVSAVTGTNAAIRSTRKTCPGLRTFDLYAVKVGGGDSFRTGLYDGVMIKDNHIAYCNGVSECVRRVREKLGNVVMTVECDTKEQVYESVLNNVNIVLLDNMSIQDIQESVKIVNGRAKIEVSGGVNLHNVKEIASCGVDYISIGCITNSVPCKDIGLDFTGSFSP